MENIQCTQNHFTNCFIKCLTNHLIINTHEVLTNQYGNTLNPMLILDLIVENKKGYRNLITEIINKIEINIERGVA